MVLSQFGALIEFSLCLFGSFYFTALFQISAVNRAESVVTVHRLLFDQTNS